MPWRPVQGVPHLLPKGSSESDPVKGKAVLDRWMGGRANLSDEFNSSTTLQSLQQNAVINCIKGITEVQRDIHREQSTVCREDIWGRLSASPEL